MPIRYTLIHFSPNKEYDGYDLEFIDQQTQQKYGVWEPDLAEFKHDFSDFNTASDPNSDLEIAQAIHFANELKRYPEHYQDEFLKLTDDVYKIED